MGDFSAVFGPLLRSSHFIVVSVQDGVDVVLPPELNPPGQMALCPCARPSVNSPISGG
jgi:hypothetical protein